jgi:hypothetical protein
VRWFRKELLAFYGNRSIMSAYDLLVDAGGVAIGTICTKIQFCAKNNSHKDQWCLELGSFNMYLGSTIGGLNQSNIDRNVAFSLYSNR